MHGLWRNAGTTSAAYRSSYQQEQLYAHQQHRRTEATQPQKDTCMKTVSIGYHREDGDFAILATLNNNDEHILEENFEQICKSLFRALDVSTTSLHIKVIKRQDTPDYVTIEGENK